MNELETRSLLISLFATHGLTAQGWTYEIRDFLVADRFGYANFETKTIQISKYEWPTTARNVREVCLHEIAHALVGHGNHNLEWWDKLIDIGGRGVWVWDHNGSVQQARITD